MVRHKRCPTCGNMMKPMRGTQIEVEIEMSKAPTKKRIPRGKVAERKISTVMEEYKDKKLRSGSKKGPKVKSKKQALAIAFSEARNLKKRVKKKK